MEEMIRKFFGGKDHLIRRYLIFFGRPDRLLLRRSHYDQGRLGHVTGSGHSL